MNVPRHSAERREKIRQGVIARNIREGRHTGEWIRDDKACKTCGTVFRQGRPTQEVCSLKCRQPKSTPEQQRRSAVRQVMKSRRNRKKLAVEYKGGKCERCGYDKCIAAMEFHHREPNEKDFSLSRTNRSLEAVKSELDKCMLLCANCHREEHFNQDQLLNPREIVVD